MLHAHPVTQNALFAFQVGQITVWDARMGFILMVRLAHLVVRFRLLTRMLIYVALASLPA